MQTGIEETVYYRLVIWRAGFAEEQVLGRKPCMQIIICAVVWPAALPKCLDLPHEAMQQSAARKKKKSYLKWILHMLTECVRRNEYIRLLLLHVFTPFHLQRYCRM